MKGKLTISSALMTCSPFKICIVSYHRGHLSQKGNEQACGMMAFSIKIKNSMIKFRDRCQFIDYNF